MPSFSSQTAALTISVRRYSLYQQRLRAGKIVLILFDAQIFDLIIDWIFLLVQFSNQQNVPSLVYLLCWQQVLSRILNRCTFLGYCREKIKIVCIFHKEFLCALVQCTSYQWWKQKTGLDLFSKVIHHAFHLYLCTSSVPLYLTRYYYFILSYIQEICQVERNGRCIWYARTQYEN